jgi:uncharacterized protein (DUF1697 family)
MKFVAFLRGVNVGGRGSISMVSLKESVESIGFTDVRTYINSGNVIFSAPRSDASVIAKRIEAAIEKATGLPLDALVLSRARLKTIVEAIPARWNNDELTKCDVMLLWKAIDDRKILNQLPAQTGIDELRYTPGAAIWRVLRKDASRSRMNRIVGSPIYKQMTIRNPNTLRKILDLMAV